MQVNRIYFLSFLFIVSLSSLIQSSDDLSDNNHAQEWSSSCTQNMSPAELQITANFLYLLYANALLDTEIQKYYTPLVKLSQIARNNLSDPHNLNNELTQLHTVTEKLSQLVKARSLYTTMLHECFNHLNKNKNDVVEAALKELQSHASNILYEWADKNTKNFATYLEKSAKTITDCEKSMQFASNLHKSLSHGILPFVVEEQEKPLAIMNVILQTTPTFMHTADTATIIFNDICNHAMETVCLGAEVYKDHYHLLHNVMMQESFDKKYTTTLFNTYSALSDEYDSLLPATDNVFEHLLTVTKNTYLVDKEHNDN